ncbi:hypothetical protein QJQ45_009114 [Haematococcus lacustris]|nr:hypothetical protein QJQ45_009114 [Haematococcus lacustris]
MNSWTLRRLGVGAAGTLGAVAATAPAASARAPPVQRQERTSLNGGLSGLKADAIEDEDGWCLTDFNNELYLFNAYRADEIALAAQDLAAMFDAKEAVRAARPSAVVVEEVPSSHTPLSQEGSSVSSEGECADEVIQSTFLTARPGQAASSGGQGQMHELLRLTSKLLCSPGLQREVVKVMMEDEEVRELMLRQTQMRNLDAYLQAVGMPATLLLPPAPGCSPSPPSCPGVAEDDAPAGTPAADQDWLAKLLNAASACLDAAGSALQGAGRWLQGRFQGLANILASRMFGEGEQEVEEGEGEQAGLATQHPKGPKARGAPSPAAVGVMGTVLTLAVVLLCVLFKQRPVIRRVSRARVCRVVAALSEQADGVKTVVVRNTPGDMPFPWSEKDPYKLPVSIDRVQRILLGLGWEKPWVEQIVDRIMKNMLRTTEERTQAVITYLTSIGLRQDEVCNMASISVVLLGLNPETRIKPVVEYLQRRGMPDESIPDLVLKHPRIFEYRLESSDASSLCKGRARIQILVEGCARCELVAQETSTGAHVQVDVLPIGPNGSKVAAVNYFRDNATFLESPVSPVPPSPTPALLT